MSDVTRILTAIENGDSSAANVTAGVYHKVFRDLVAHMNHLDDLVALSAGAAGASVEAIWSTSLRPVRDQFESLLSNWGVQTIEIRIGQDLFDPEIHEAVLAEDDEPLPDGPKKVVLKVRQRGWKLHDVVLQHPQFISR